MTRLHGRSPRGQRLNALVPRGHWETMTCVGALQSDGLCAPCVLDGPVNAESVLACVEQILTPTLRPGDLVAMDTLSSHKGLAIRQAMRAAGAKLFFLPPYRPDLNLIEQVVSKLKTLLRKAAERTVETTWKRTGTLLEALTPAEYANYVRNSGYVSAWSRHALECLTEPARLSRLAVMAEHRSGVAVWAMSTGAQGIAVRRPA